MLNFIDNWLNRITMYRLLLWYLIALIAIAVGYAAFGLIAYSPLSILLSTALILAVGWITNTVFAHVFKAPTNVESVYLSALILVLILPPLTQLSALGFLIWATVWTMASKFIFAWHRKHIFNPVAAGVLIAGLGLSQSATWWIGSITLLPWVLIGGILIVRKIRRSELVIAFLLTTLVTVVAASLLSESNVGIALGHLAYDSPLFFLAFVMLTEPLTTPPTVGWQQLYGGLVGFLFAPQVHLLSLYFTPEMALLVGNVFSWSVSPKSRLFLTLKQRIKIAPDIADFVFTSDRPLKFTAGQYLEWTLPHEHPDNRGNRRYFTINSAPSDSTIRVGVKFYENSSSFKHQLAALKPGDQIVASQLSGDFTLPKNPAQKLVFIAGGIGVTPFRSMVEHLLKEKSNRDIVLLYSAKSPDQLVYADVFDAAAQQLGLKTAYVVSDANAAKQAGWKGLVGTIDAHYIQQAIPDLHDRTVYISGPHGMVTVFQKSLSELGLQSSQIITDYFPGFA